MKKTLVLGLCLLLATHSLWAQDEEDPDAPKKGFQKEKLFAGGYLGLSFGDYTYINISPQLGYRFSKYFAAGLGINAQYVNSKNWDFYGNQYRQEQTVLGLNVFGRVYPFRSFMLLAQPEVNYMFGKMIYEGPPKQEFKSDAVIVPSLLLGGGLVLPAGRGETIITISYDVLQDPNSPYGHQAIYSFGYNVGF